MQIKKIHIQNYRSLKDFRLEVSPYSVLIGENNAGKTNILRALNLVLGETWPSERSFSEDDFYNQDTGNDILIQVYFDQIIEKWINNHEMRIAGIQLCCKAYKKRVGDKPAGTLKVDYNCILPNGKEATYPDEKLVKGQRSTARWLPFRVSNEIRENLPFIYVEVLRDYNRQTPSSRWSLLRRLFNDVNTEFLNDKDLINFRQDDGKVIEITRKKAFELAVQSSYKYLRIPKFVEIEKRLTANALENMGLDSKRNKVELRFEAHDPINAFKSLQLYVDQMGVLCSAGEVGAGLQSAIVVAIFRTYEEFKREGAVFAIEEPEVFLHPQKARYFSSVLQRLAESGNQVLLTTHSPLFTELHKPESVVIIRRTEKEGTWAERATVEELTSKDRQTLRLLSEFDSERKEVFFAKGVMLVEGATEKISLPLIFQALELDINRLGISVVDVGGKTKFCLFIRVLNAFGIPYVVLVDHDMRKIDDGWTPSRKIKERERNQKHEQWNEEIEAECASGSLFWMKGDFEEELGLPQNESEKLDRAFELFQNAKAEDIPQCLLIPIKALIQKLT